MINLVYIAKEGFRGGTPRGRGCPEMYSLRAGGRLSPIKILLAIVFITLSTLLSAEVQCVWSGTEYVCSGEGASVVVSGGGGTLPPVVTNMVGVCTNCSAISPDRLLQLANLLAEETDSIDADIDSIIYQANYVHELVESNLTEIATYQSWSAYKERHQATNYMYTVDNSQTEGMKYVYENQTTGMVAGSRLSGAMSAGNGIYYYANNTVKPNLQEAQNRMESVVLENANYLKSESIPALVAMSQELREGAVACQGDTPSTNNNNNAGGNLTGDWCTYDQGEAIKSLLTELKTLLQSWEDYIENIQKYIKGVGEAISKGLFSTYPNIPDNTDWKTVYLNGQETDWGYVPTNTLQRIEMLIYGLSGVSTNGPVFESGSTSAEEIFSSYESDKQQLTTTLQSIATDADSTKVETLGGAIQGFFQAFSVSGTELREGDNVIPSVSIGSGANEVYIPSFNVGSTSLQLHNTTQSVVRAVLVAFYMILAAFAIFLYWQWFAEKAISFTKWATELVSSIFS